MNNPIYLQLISLNKNHNQHFLRRYVKFVSFYKERNFKKKKFLHHEHHIIPESFGGPDTKENLVCITIREHFILHHLLYKAFPKSTMVNAFHIMCHCSGQKISSKVHEKLMLEFAERVSENNLKRVAEGKNPFSGGEISRRTNKKRVAEGKHHFQDKEKASKRAIKQVADGKHPWQDKEKARQRAIKQIADGKNALVGPENVRKQLENGTHPTQIKKLCPHCNRLIDIANFSHYHGDKCKLNPLYKKEIKEKFECPHCHRYFSKSMFTRYHNDNCKLKP